jgi:hypothetical protein
MYACAPDSPCTPAQRQWITERLQHTQALTSAERAKVRTPLLDWYWKAHPRTAPLVAKQFEED